MHAGAAGSAGSATRPVPPIAASPPSPPHTPPTKRPGLNTPRRIERRLDPPHDRQRRRVEAPRIEAAAQLGRQRLEHRPAALPRARRRAPLGERRPAPSRRARRAAGTRRRRCRRARRSPPPPAPPRPPPRSPPRSAAERRRQDAEAHDQRILVGRLRELAQRAQQRVAALGRVARRGAVRQRRDARAPARRDAPRDPAQPISSDGAAVEPERLGGRLVHRLEQHRLHVAVEHRLGARQRLAQRRRGPLAQRLARPAAAAP